MELNPEGLDPEVQDILDRALEAASASRAEAEEYVDDQLRIRLNQQREQRRTRRRQRVAAVWGWIRRRIGMGL